ncbi:hypothetical protein X743_30705 [Mesorhizobium sp. LNHC252B00]|nr:hypothetical protein X743_30705 [Mesorhizobium sp. LNHC252B00]
MLLRQTLELQKAEKFPEAVVYGEKMPAGR